jgi:ribosomal protein L19E
VLPLSVGAETRERIPRGCFSPSCHLSFLCGGEVPMLVRRRRRRKGRRRKEEQEEGQEEAPGVISSQETYLSWVLCFFERPFVSCASPSLAVEPCKPCPQASSCIQRAEHRREGRRLQTPTPNPKPQIPMIHRRAPRRRETTASSTGRRCPSGSTFGARHRRLPRHTEYIC